MWTLIFWFVLLELTTNSFDGTRVEDVDDTCLHNFMKGKRIMPTIMKNFFYLFVAEYMSENFFWHVYAVHVSVQVHSVDIKQEGVYSVV